MKRSGIYVIQSKLKPERLYVGSAVDIKDRWRGHRKDLNKGTHHSKQMQRHVNKYGLDDLLFSVCEFCEKEELLTREQEYLDIIDPVFNSCKKAGNMLGFKFSPESIEKMRASHVGKPTGRKGIKLGPEGIEHMRRMALGNKNSANRVITEEYRQRCREKQLGKKASAETRAKLRITQKGKHTSNTLYTFEHVTYGTEVCTMYELTTKYNIPKGYINHLCKGAMKSARGWIVVSTTN